MNTVSRIGCLAVAVMACAGFADDAVWMQQKAVAIGSANFQECVSTAISGVNGVQVNRTVAPSKDKVALEVKLAKPIPFLVTEVQHRGGTSAVIVFSGRGDSESDADRAQVSPVLQSIADAISAKCGAAKK